jgi:hypothetical protein
MDTPENRSPTYLPLSIFRIPRYRYFPTNLMKQSGPDQWERLWILQACERLEIPVKLWPKWPFPEILSRPVSIRSYIPREKIASLEFPPFNALEETLSEWKVRCHKVLDDLLEEYAKKFDAQFQDAMKRGFYIKLPQSRATTPSDLRYEWVARRICYRTPYKELATRGYSAERIKQSVLQILKKAKLKEGI